MNRFIDYIRHRIPLSKEAEAFLREHGRVLAYDRLSHFLTPDTRAPYWCVVLEGMAYGYTLAEDGQRRTRWVATEMPGFAGVRTLYTPKPGLHYMQFAPISHILRVTALQMREGKKRLPEVSELLHLKNQRYQERQD